MGKPPLTAVARKTIKAAQLLRDDLNDLKFAPPIFHTYNPLEYAWEAHRSYIRLFGNNQKRILFLGMNPGPYGMMQTGVPFGEINAVKGWMDISDTVTPPEHQHPKRPIEGFACKRSEVSGRRLWGLFAQRFPNPNDFFEDHFVINYCPLVFLEESGRNFTPDKLPRKELNPVSEACDRHLVEIIKIYQPEYLIGVGAFAAKRAVKILGENTVKIGQILHPSPASPKANRDWAGQATAQLEGIWR